MKGRYGPSSPLLRGCQQHGKYWKPFGLVCAVRHQWPIALCYIGEGLDLGQAPRLEPEAWV